MELLSIILVGIVMIILLMLVKKLSKFGNSKPTKNNEEKHSRFDSNEQNDEEENLPPGFHYAEPILQDLYHRNRIDDHEFVHYNRYKPQDLAQMLIDDRICTERELPMDLRRFLQDEE